MEDITPEQKTILEYELIFGVRRRERFAYTISFISLIIGLCGVVAVVLLLPLKEVQAYLTIVDKDTGIAERAVTVEKAVLDQSEAVVQSLLFGYVMDRETFDENDNDKRILNVYRRSNSRQREVIKSLWNENSATFPPTVYGADALVEVKINNITPLSNNASQVRFTKILKLPDNTEQEGKFYVTISYEFKPDTRNSLALVWENPYGFYVTGYRVAGETLEN